MSELLESAPPSLPPIVELLSATPLDFDALALDVSYIDPNLQAYDFDHYMQEVRIAELNIDLLAFAKKYYEANDYGNARLCVERVMTIVAPTNNEALLQKLISVKEQLYR